MISDRYTENGMLKRDWFRDGRNLMKIIFGSRRSFHKSLTVWFLQANQIIYTLIMRDFDEFFQHILQHKQEEEEEETTHK